jgi:hypothetical protein
MAESTTPSTSSTSSTSSTPTSSATPAASKQYIRASTDDNALEPDALRGSEHVIKDLKLQDDEADRRKVYEEKAS